GDEYALVGVAADDVAHDVDPQGGGGVGDEHAGHGVGPGGRAVRVGADQVIRDRGQAEDVGAVHVDAVAVVAGHHVGPCRAAPDGGVVAALDGNAVPEVRGGGAVHVQADSVALDKRHGRRIHHENSGEVVEADDVFGAARGAADDGAGRGVLDDDADRIS